MPISHFVVLPLHSASLCQFSGVLKAAAPVQSAFPCQLLMLPMYAGTCAGAPYLALIAAPIHEASFPHRRSSVVHAALSMSQRVLDCCLTVHPDNFEGADENYDYSLRYDDFIAPLVAYCQNLKKKNTELENKLNKIYEKLGLSD